MDTRITSILESMILLFLVFSSIWISTSLIFFTINLIKELL